MAKNFAIAFGTVYLLTGLSGFVMPSPILGIFGVNVLHNLVHIAIGGLWLAAALAMGAGAPRMASGVIGAVLLVVSLLGFVAPDLSLSLLAINPADNFLHLATALLALAIGFMSPKELATA